MQTMQNKTFLIAGGDLRQLYLAASLSTEYKVYAIGFTKNVLPEGDILLLESITQLEERVDYIILPLPACADGVTIAAPYGNGPIPLASLLPMLKQSGRIFGGMLDEALTQKLLAGGMPAADYYKREELVVLNAVPTAEGALQIMMEELPCTLYGQRILITGYGRIGRVLTKYLTALGAIVTVTARRHSDLAWAEIMGAHAVHLSRLESALGGFDVIINTVPALLLGERQLALVKKGCLVLDLASKPGGVDLEAARAAGIKTIWALSLPGKVAPVTSGEIIASTIRNMLEEEDRANV